MKLFYQRTGRSAEWNEDTAKTEFLYFIFQDYITTKQKNISEIDEFIEEMADVNEEKEFMKDGFNKTEFDSINKNALEDIQNEKISELKVLGNKEEIFQTALKFVGDFKITEASDKINLQKKLKITSDFDKEVFIKKGWGNDYGTYFSKVFDTIKKTEKKEKNKEIRTFTLNEDKVEGNLTKVKKLQEAGFQYITKESVPAEGSTGMGDMKYSRTRAATRQFGGDIKNKIIELDELNSFYEDGVVATRRKGLDFSDSSKGGKAVWEYETADLLYTVQRLLYFSGEFKDAKDKLKLPKLGKKQTTIEIPKAYETSVKIQRQQFKKLNAINEEIDTLIELSKKGKKLNISDLKKIHEGFQKIQNDFYDDFHEITNVKKYKTDTLVGKKQTGFNGYKYAFNAASIKLAKKYASTEGELAEELKGKSKTKFYNEQLELYYGDINHFLAWITKELDNVMLYYIDQLQKYGREILDKIEEEAGIKFKQNLSAKEAWDKPEVWLKRQLNAILNDIQHLYEVTVIVEKTTVNDNDKYTISKWHMKPKFDLLPSGIQRYTAMGQKLGGGSFVADEQMQGAKPRKRKFISTDENVDYKTQKKVSVFAKTIDRRFNELKSVI